MFGAVFVVSDLYLSSPSRSQRLGFNIFVLISKINKSSNHIPGFCCSCQNGRSCHLCESSQSPKSGFHVQNHHPEPLGFFCAQNRSSMCITASQNTNIWHPWPLCYLADSLRLKNTWLWLLKAAYFLYRVLRWPKLQRSDPCLLLSRSNNTSKRLCFFSPLATEAKGLLSPSSWHRLLWLLGWWRAKLYQDSRHVEILHFFSI